MKLRVTPKIFYFVEFTCIKVPLSPSLALARARSLYLSRSPHAQKTLGTRLFISGRDKGEGEVVLGLR